MRPWALIAVICSTVLAGCGGTSSFANRNAPRGALPGARPAANPGPPLGRFAGYAWYGEVHSVQASWTVPRVLSRSGVGESSTWIGAETPAWRREAPFIQIGTNEGRFASADHAHVNDVYWAFWSDTEHGFHPIDLFPVRGGDRIAATLTLNRGRWTLDVRDLSSGTNVDFATSEEASDSFAMAEWEQEDVGSFERQGPYPRLSVSTFRGLRVDGAAPDPSRLVSQWMSTNIGTVAPSGLDGDSFTVRPVRLGASAARYLSIARLENQAYLTFAWQIRHWTAATPTHEILSEQAIFGAVLGRSVSAFEASQWPRAAQPVVDALVAQTRELFALTTSGEATFPGGLTRWKRLWLRQMKSLAWTAGQARETLGLPTGPTG